MSSILIANLHVAVWPFIFIIALPYIAEYIISLIAEIVVYRKGTIAYKKHVIKKCKSEEKVKKAQEEVDKIKKVREEEEP